MTMAPRNPPNPTRRDMLVAAAGLLSLAVVPSARATPDGMEAAIRAFVGEAPTKPGPITLDVPALVENGNAVPLTVNVDGPMTAERFVKVIAVFNEKNPQPNVAVFHLGPRSGRATVSTRIRLADSQKLIAVAQMSDGSFISASADVLVTLAACVETG